MVRLAYSNAPASFRCERPGFSDGRGSSGFLQERPLLLQRHLPLWLNVHAQRGIAVLVTAIVFGLSLFRSLPAAYEWHIRRRLLYWYRQRKTLEGSVEREQSSKDKVATRAAVDKFEEAVTRPSKFSYNAPHSARRLSADAYFLPGTVHSVIVRGLIRNVS